MDQCFCNERVSNSLQVGEVNLQVAVVMHNIGKRETE